MDYTGNSNKGKETGNPPEKKIEKVVTGEVIQRPRSVGRKFKDVFFGGEIKSAARFVTADVILPAFRDLLVDAITNGAKRVVYGESMYRRRPYEYRPRITYNSPLTTRSYYRDPRGDPRDQRDLRDPRERVHLPDQPTTIYRPPRPGFNDIILARKEDAELVVERLIDIIEKYEVASLADLYDLLGYPASPVDNKWGWTYLSNMEVRQVRDGFLIDLPPLEAV